MTGKAWEQAPLSIGRHLGERLVEIGVDHFFGVPGDFNLVLLDELLATKGLNMVGCCNELNAGYAADGYARGKGVGCVVVTFDVGGFSVMNAVAGAFAENLPVICVSGAPNSSSYGSNNVLHHTLGLPDFTQQYRCMKEITAAQCVVRHLDDAAFLIDATIAKGLELRKPVYIEIACNLASKSHASLTKARVPFAIRPHISNAQSLDECVNTAIEFLNSKGKVVLVGGVHLRNDKSKAAFATLADASAMPVALMPDAKGMFNESHERYIGTYWGPVSTDFVQEIVESADACIFVGPNFTDYSTTGYSLLLSDSKMIKVDTDCVTIGGKLQFGCVLLPDFLTALAKKIKPNDTSYQVYKRLFVRGADPDAGDINAPLRVNRLFFNVQRMLQPHHAVLAETGDAWFHCQKLRLPDGCKYEFQMQYGSIGWSVGAVLGWATALRDQKRVLAFIGDGSFQMTAQEVSTIARNGLNPVIFLLNNKGYTIETQIHDGPYNYIQNWDYTGLAEALNNKQGKLFTTKIHTEAELQKALQEVQARKDHFCFLEVMLDRDDCSKELLEWGSRVSAANSRS